VAHVRARIRKERLAHAVTLNRGQADRLSCRGEVTRQAIKLLAIENRVTPAEEDFLERGFAGFLVNFGFLELVEEEDVGGFLALFHVGPEFVPLLDGEPYRADIAFLEGGRPKDQDVNAPVLLAARAQGASDRTGGVFDDLPRLHPGKNPAFKVGNDLVCNPVVNVLLVLHGGSS